MPLSPLPDFSRPPHHDATILAVPLNITPMNIRGIAHATVHVLQRGDNLSTTPQAMIKILLNSLISGDKIKIYPL